MDSRQLAAAVGVAALSAGLLCVSRAQAQTTQDTLFIEAIKRQGADLSIPLRITNDLEFPTQEAADRAAAKLSALGYSVEKTAVAVNRWRLSVAKMALPNEAVLAEMGKELQDLVTSEKGSGGITWGTRFRR